MVVDRVGVVEAGAGAQVLDEVVGIVDEAVGLHREAVDLDALGDLEAGIAMADVLEVGVVAGRQLVGVIPAHDLGELASLLGGHGRVVDDVQHLAGDGLGRLADGLWLGWIGPQGPKITLGGLRGMPDGLLGLPQ